VCPQTFRVCWLRLARSLTCLVLLISAAAVGMTAVPASAAVATTIINFDDSGNQLVKFDTAGNAVDAHDGEIAVFNDFRGTYFFYGTSYDCGHHWQQSPSRFCGFKVYTSHDLAHWTDGGLLFDPSGWQQKCEGRTYGCFRPHVVFNASTRKYVLWINTYDNVSGYHVFESDRPTGPFTEVKSDVSLAVNPGAGNGGLNNGDHDVFVDDDGVAYLAYTMWRNGGGDIAIEKLDSRYTNGVGSASPQRDFARVGQSSTEAPALFKRNGTYYLTYSDPNRGYQEVGTSYRTASSPLGPWSAPINISRDVNQSTGQLGSCGGQPDFVTPIATSSGTIFLYGSDLWDQGRPNRSHPANQGLANHFWAPLNFDGNGRISEINCMAAKRVTLTLTDGSPDSQLTPDGLDQSDGVDGFQHFCDIRSGIQRMQTFVAGRSGPLTSVAFTSFQATFSGNYADRPEAGLRIEVYLANGAFQPVGSALYSTVVAPSAVGWTARNIIVRPNIQVTAGTRYGIKVSTDTTANGCYGMVHSYSAPYPGGGQSYSNNSGASFQAEANRSLKFYTTVGAGVGVGGDNPPTTTPPTNPPAGGTWAPLTPYSVGATVTYSGSSYRCVLAHTSLPGWEPPNTPALWQRI
jgi:hypothetical protein